MLIMALCLLVVVRPLCRNLDAAALHDHLDNIPDFAMCDLLESRPHTAQVQCEHHFTTCSLWLAFM